MTAITSNGTGGGVASAGASWAGGVAPGVGDTCRIASGDTITIDLNWTIGADSATPAIDVLNGGILVVNNPAASYTVTCSGDFYVRNGGTFTADMSTQPTFTFTLALNSSASLAIGKYGFRCENGGIVTLTGANKTRSYDTISVAAAIGGNTVSTTNDNSAVWGATDDIVVSGAAGQSEQATLTGIVGVQLTRAGVWTNAHGTIYYVGNLTRNVRVIAVNTSFPTFIYSLSSPAGSTIQNTFAWVEFKDITVSGPLVAAGHACGIGVTKVSFTYCSAWLTAAGNGGINVINPTNGYSVLNYNVIYCRGGVNGHGIYIYTLTTNTAASTLNYNLCIHCGVGYRIRSCTGLSPTSNIAHDMVTGGTLNAAMYYLDTCAQITHSGGEIRSAAGSGLRIDSLFGSTVSNMTIGAVTGLRFVTLAGVTFTGITTLGTTTDISNVSGFVDAYMYDSTLVGATKVSGTLLAGSTIRMKNVTNVDTGHRTFADYGQYARDTSTPRTGTYNMIMSPTSASSPLIATSTVPASNGVQIVVSAYFRKNATYGSSNLPFLRLSGVGIVTSTATMADINNTYLLLVVSGTPTEDGFAKVEFVAQSSGANAAVYVDDVRMVYTAIDTGGMDYWFEGNLPTVLMSTGLGATDVWEAATSGMTTVGSIGLLLTTDIDATISSRATPANITAAQAVITALLPAALVGGRMDSSVGAMANDVITAAALSAGAGDEMADALLDRINAIEAGLTPRQAMRLWSAALAGVLSGAGTNAISIRNAVANTKARIDATVDADGNRLIVVTDTA